MGCSLQQEQVLKGQRFLCWRSSAVWPWVRQRGQRGEARGRFLSAFSSPTSSWKRNTARRRADIRLRADRRDDGDRAFFAPASGDSEEERARGRLLVLKTTYTRGPWAPWPWPWLCLSLWPGLCQGRRDISRDMQTQDRCGGSGSLLRRRTRTGPSTRDAEGKGDTDAPRGVAGVPGADGVPGVLEVTLAGVPKADVAPGVLEVTLTGVPGAERPPGMLEETLAGVPGPEGAPGWLEMTLAGVPGAAGTPGVLQVTLAGAPGVGGLGNASSWLVGVLAGASRRNKPPVLFLAVPGRRAGAGAGGSGDRLTAHTLSTPCSDSIRGSGEPWLQLQQRHSARLQAP